ncbi:hypothetical protein GCM10010917_36380 [Paenibacillus physcomitrellae]|uniref:Uncharacterized protein n=1 Tax=Paenibacillus physcomitrellae TaxID=1619311 RepID=A0ABQ1GPC1_9BACL|nr:hypothetical protein GCM10010917_36380 [Paenibacillus physcomitrellae]
MTAFVFYVTFKRAILLIHIKLIEFKEINKTCMLCEVDLFGTFSHEQSFYARAG